MLYDQICHGSSVEIHRKRIGMALTIAGSDLTFDLAGIAPQLDRPRYMQLESTVDIAIYLAIRSILLGTETHEMTIMASP
jgi:N-methylhydantoinase B